MICITSYKRPEMLLSLLQELQGYNVHVFDDCSDYDYSEHAKYCTYHRSTQWRSKVFFWKQWNWILDVCKVSDDDWFLFTQDDVQNIDLSRIKDYCRLLEGDYALNIMDIGEDRGWTWREVTESDVNGLNRCGYVDCNFACNRGALDKIGWSVDPIPIERFKVDNISSGVGQWMSRRFDLTNVKMYLPKEQLAYHGDHESVMHKEERKLNPLVSK